jgi:hypothetical protein
VTARLLPYWYDAIVPDLRAGGCVLVVSHGIPLAYQLGPDMRPVTGARYLSHRPGMTANDLGY